MDVQRYAFLVATLGEDGAQALAKASERVPTLQHVLVPRAVLAWLQVQDQDFEGQLPGLENTYLTFAKSQDGLFTGTIAVGDTSYGFEAASDMHLAASIGIALGTDVDAIDPQLRDQDLQRLGKSIDLLCKARKAVEDVALAKAEEFLDKKVLDPGAGYQLGHMHFPQGMGGDGGEPMTTIHAQHPSMPGQHVGEATFSHNPDGKTITPEMSFVHPEHRRLGLGSAIYAHAEKITGKKVVPSPMQSEHALGLWSGNAQQPQFGKGEPKAAGGAKGVGPGPAAAARPPQEPQAPLAPVATQPKMPVQQPKKSAKPITAPKTQAKVPDVKAPSVKLTMSQTKQPCPVCGLPNFKGERLVGCLCFGDLAKSTTTERTQEGMSITFGPDWDADAMDVFLEGFRHKGKQ